MPHTSLSNAQNARRNARLQVEMESGVQLTRWVGIYVDDFTNAGFSKGTINGVLEQHTKC